MKKYLYTFLILIFCFLLSSFSLIILSPFNKVQISEDKSYVNSQKLYAVIDAVQNYSADIEKTGNEVIDRLAYILASSMAVDFSDVQNGIEQNPDSIEITAYFIDYNKAYFRNNTEFDFAAYSQYTNLLSSDAMVQAYNMASDISLYTLERKITVTFSEADDDLFQAAIFNTDDMQQISKECLEAAQNIYSDYISKSDMSTAFLLESIKTLPLDSIADVYNEANPETPIQEEWQKSLFASYARYYLSSMVIDDILISSSDSKTYKASIDYKTEHGDTTITHVFNNRLDEYYETKQPPADKMTVTIDFASELSLYQYNDTSDLYSKTFDFTYTQNLNDFVINNDFYIEIGNDIYEEYTAYESILNNFYPMMENGYFFIEMPYGETTVSYDNTGSTRYRQLDM